MKNYYLLFFYFLTTTAFSQLPDTDIWLFDIKADTDSLIFSDPVNITARKGYDNQPAFSPDGRFLLYTSIRDEKQSDIYRYDLLLKTTSAFTKTNTSEYSPTFMPDGKNISVVMVEKDSTQRLWKFPLKGGKPSVILKQTDSIGYHTWLTGYSLTLIMITEPPTLVLADLEKGAGTTYATGISRCVQPSPDGKGFYYLEDHLSKDSTWLLKDSQFPGKNSLSLPAASQDFCVFSTDEIPPVIVYGCNSILWGFYKDTMETMCRFDLSSLGIKKISRLALSADRKKIAIVAE